MQSRLLDFADELSAICARVFAYIGAIVVLGLIAAKFVGAPIVEAAIDHSAGAQWVDVERPYRAFAASVPEFSEPEPDYAIHRLARGGAGRKDVMRWGPAWNDPAGNGSRLMIEVYRPAQEIRQFGDAASEVTARTAEIGGPYSLTPADAIDSKFGRFSVFSFTANTVTGNAGRSRNCLGFARAFEDPLMQIAGWYCKADAEVVDPKTLACALERLSLLMAASEPKVTALFAKADLQRKPCAATPSRAHRASNTQRRDWISVRKAPRLRGRMVTR
jgi:hypothetical protein